MLGGVCDVEAGGCMEVQHGGGGGEGGDEFGGSRLNGKGVKN